MRTGYGTDGDKTGNVINLLIPELIFYDRDHNQFTQEKRRVKMHISIHICLFCLVMYTNVSMFGLGTRIPVDYRYAQFRIDPFGKGMNRSLFPHLWVKEHFRLS